MLPAPFPPIYLLKPKVDLAPCGDHNLPTKASGTSIYSVMERLPPSSKRSPGGHQDLRSSTSLWKFPEQVGAARVRTLNSSPFCVSYNLPQCSLYDQGLFPSTIKYLSLQLWKTDCPSTWEIFPSYLLYHEDTDQRENNGESIHVFCRWTQEALLWLWRPCMLRWMSVPLDICAVSLKCC